MKFQRIKDLEKLYITIKANNRMPDNIPNEKKLPVAVVKKRPPLLVPLITSLGVPVMPETVMGINVSQKDKRLVRHAVKKCDGIIGFVLTRKDSSGDKEHPKRTALYKMGTLARIVREDVMPDGELHVMCHAERRMHLERVMNVDGILMAEVSFPESDYGQSPMELREITMLMFEVISALHKLSEIRPMPDDLRKLLSGSHDGAEPGHLADVAATIAIASPDEYQAILETLNVRERLEKALFLLEKDLEDMALKDSILQRVKNRMDKDHRTYVLREQLREIKQELGEDIGSREDDLEKYEALYQELKPYLNSEADMRIRDEISRISVMQPQSAEYTISKNYLDWLTGLPWAKCTEDRFDIAEARRILERDHCGLDDVKKRILEFIAVAKLKNKIGGSIVCLIGPPGVGKTSLGRSIAEALGRKFFRFSLGGMHDEAEIKGHRRTYIGAQPGKMISAMKTCGVKNPVIMLDEIDKLGASAHGDPGAALLEVLDPEQNSTFRDHFMDVPFDLSEVFFIATANVRDTIPPALQDRMEIINLSGYIMGEKIDIAKKHLIPKQLTRHGLTKKNFSLSESTLRTIILNYARESGVRHLEKCIGTCMRRAAMRIAEGSVPPDKRISVKVSELEEYLGKPEYFDDPLMKESRPGVAMGLAWTAVGGTTLYIEVLPMEGKEGSFKVTGQLGDVMKESVQIAYSVVEAHAKEFGIKKDFFKTHKLHIHVPAGATPKDGPSAGITMATAIISAATGRALPKSWAMTGELTLTSRVLPVGGIKEKVIAAHRAGVRSVILPALNEKDYNDIHQPAREGMTAHFVSDYSEVYRLLF